MKKIICLICISMLFGCASKKISVESSKSQEALMVSAKNYSGLVSLYTGLIKQDDSVYNREMLANYYYLLKDYEASAYHLDNLIKRGNVSSDILYKQSINYYMLDRFELSQTLINKAISMAPNEAKYHNQNGILLSQKKEYSKAISEFEKARELFLDDNKVKNNISLVYYQQGMYQKALETIMPVYLRNTNDKKITANIICILSKLNDSAYVLKLLDEKYRISGNDALYIYNTLSGK